MRYHALALTLTLAVGTASADEPVPFSQGMALTTKYRCNACHSVDKAKAGPSFHDVAKHYAEDPHARDEIGNSILNGSSGAWGTPNPMPSTAVSDSDLKPLVEWILAQTQ